MEDEQLEKRLFRIVTDRFAQNDPSIEWECENTKLPEQRLAEAVLYRAICDYFKTRKAGSQIEKSLKGVEELHRDAKEWLFDESESDEEFSFYWICLVLFGGEEAETRMTRIREMLLKGFYD